MQDIRRTSKRVVILLAEDDPGDQELTRRALQHDVLRADLRVVENGEEALDYLYRRGRFAEPGTAPRPDLILLDLNMPKLGGREVLAELKRDPSLCRIPVVVLTTSNQETDIVKSYDLGCNSYIQKPVDIEQFMDSVRKLENYWFEVVTLPPVAGELACSA
ncbi:MAG TPA: response regulator [Pirellulaceae bacterium]|nr:response regulator [Pirellulaceae bacterium]